jgi:hypothetical protein
MRPCTRNRLLGYIPAGLLAVSILFLLAWMDRWEWWLAALTSLAVAYFIAGLALKNAWGTILRFSGLGLAALSTLYAVLWPLEGAGWFVSILTLIWLAETLLKKRPWAEGGFYLSGVLAFGLLLHQYDLLTLPYFLAGAAIYLLGFDLIFGFSMARTPLLALPVRGLGGLATAVAIITSASNGISAGEVLVAFALTIFFWVYMPMRRQSLAWLHPRRVAGGQCSLSGGLGRLVGVVALGVDCTRGGILRRQPGVGAFRGGMVAGAAH